MPGNVVNIIISAIHQNTFANTVCCCAIFYYYILLCAYIALNRPQEDSKRCWFYLHVVLLVDVTSKSIHSQPQLCSFLVLDRKVVDAIHVKILSELEIVHHGFFTQHSFVAAPPCDDSLLPLLLGQFVLFLNSVTHKIFKGYVIALTSENMQKYLPDKENVGIWERSFDLFQAINTHTFTLTIIWLHRLTVSIHTKPMIRQMNIKLILHKKIYQHVYHRWTSELF